MPYELHGTYYTMTEISEKCGINLSALSHFVSRMGGCEKVTIGKGSRGGVCLIPEHELPKILAARPTQGKRSQAKTGGQANS